MSITSDGTLAYTNNIAAVPVTLKKVGVNNTDPTMEEHALSGATFDVYDSVTGGSIVSDADGNQLTNKTSDNNGVFYTGKLKYGTYYLEEKSVPDGYNAPLGRFKLEVSKESEDTTITGEWITSDPSKSAGTVTYDATQGYTITVRNVAGVSLPSTGGPGDGILYLFGGLMIACACAILVRKRMTLSRVFCH